MSLVVSILLLVLLPLFGMLNFVGSLIPFPSRSMTQNVKLFSWTYGFVLILVGVGVLLPYDVLFTSEVYTNYGFFHLLAGFLGLVASREGEAFARWYLIIFGLVYALVGFDGLLWGGYLFENLSLPHAGNSYVYFVLGVVGIGAGLTAKSLSDLKAALRV